MCDSRHMGGGEDQVVLTVVIRSIQAAPRVGQAQSMMCVLGDQDVVRVEVGV